MEIGLTFWFSSDIGAEVDFIWWVFGLVSFGLITTASAETIEVKASNTPQDVKDQER